MSCKKSLQSDRDEWLVLGSGLLTLFLCLLTVLLS